MTEQTPICHFFSVCGEAGVPGYSYPYYLDYYNAPNQADKAIKSNDFYLAVGSPSAGSVVRVTGTNNPVWQGGQYVSHPLDVCLTYNGTSNCGGGMSSYLLTASGTPMSDCDSCERWDCKPQGSHPKFGSKCIQAGPGGQFTTQQDCIASGCEGFSDDSKDTKTQTPFNPLTFDPQTKITQPDDEFGTLEPEIEPQAKTITACTDDDDCPDGLVHLECCINGGCAPCPQKYGEPEVPNNMPDSETPIDQSFQALRERLQNLANIPKK